jgi:hypothetical protein
MPRRADLVRDTADRASFSRAPRRSFAALQLSYLAGSSVRKFLVEVVVFDGDDVQGSGERLVCGAVVVAFLA